MFLYKVSFPIVYNLCPALEFKFGPSKKKKYFIFGTCRFKQLKSEIPNEHIVREPLPLRAGPADTIPNQNRVRKACSKSIL